MCVCERLADKSGGFELTVTLLPNKNVTAAVIAIVVLALTNACLCFPRVGMRTVAVLVPGY